MSWLVPSVFSRGQAMMIGRLPRALAIPIERHPEPYRQIIPPAALVRKPG